MRFPGKQLLFAPLRSISQNAPLAAQQAAAVQPRSPPILNQNADQAVPSSTSTPHAAAPQSRHHSGPRVVILTSGGSRKKLLSGITQDEIYYTHNI